MYGSYSRNPAGSMQIAIANYVKAAPGGKVTKDSLRGTFAPADIDTAVDCRFIFPVTIGATAYYEAN